MNKLSADFRNAAALSSSLVLRVVYIKAIIHSKAPYNFKKRNIIEFRGFLNILEFGRNKTAQSKTVNYDN